MKKSILLPFLAVGLLFGSSSAFAVPALDGLIGAGEWDNSGTGGNAYPFYLDASDPNEADIPDAYDIKRVVLLQELNGHPSGDGDADVLAPNNGAGDNDGVYLLIETYDSPSLADAAIGPPPAFVSLVADFNGSGTIDGPVGPFPADLQILIYNSGGTDVVEVCVGPVVCSIGSGTVVPSSLHARGADAIELFFPTGAFGTPLSTPFPNTFQGTGIYDNGGDAPDDRVTASATVIPEPSTMLLMGAGLLGLVAYGRKNK